MSFPLSRVPYRVPSDFVKSEGERKAAQKRFAMRLKMTAWLTIPRNVFPPVPVHGLALFPTNPSVVWQWDIGSIIDWRSDALIWIGFFRSDPHFPFSIN